MKHRVVVTGLGVCAPTGNTIKEFEASLQLGQSGIRFQEDLKALNFKCQIAGRPDIESLDLTNYFNKVQLKGLNSTGLVYGMVAGLNAWQDAHLPMPDEQPDWDSGAIFGTGILGVDKFREAVYKVDQGAVRRLGSTAVVQTMASGVSAYLAGSLGLGNRVTANSAACATGTEAILLGYEHIAKGGASRMLVGSCSDSGPYVWGGFDAMRILPTTYNDHPTMASRPMSATAAGFVPASGAGALVLESLASAKKRGAPIYAELLGGHANSGGQRQGGSLTAANPIAVQRCIEMALKAAGVTADDLDAINGHLTATTKDPDEIFNWGTALDRWGVNFPYINSFKGHFGHALAAAGSLESVASVLQIKNGQLYGTLNADDLHPTINTYVDPTKIVRRTLAVPPKILAKASFGFGDVNCCLIFKKY